MDYKYIDQLLERYWKCETSLEEEEILRAFFSQEDIPARLLQYKDLFTYEQNEKKEDVLGEDFDQKIMSIIGEEQKPKARIVPMHQRLKPLFKAAAVVAIFITLGNAAQMASDSDESNYNGEATEQLQKGANVALGDSAAIDSLQQSSIESATTSSGVTILK